MATLFVCGDISNPIKSMNFIGNRLCDIINTADYSVGNLEGVEVQDGDKLVGSPFQGPGTCQYLKETGFNMMLLANNHIADGGKERLKHTLNTLDNYEIDHLGAGFTSEEIYKPLIIEINTLKIAMLNVCEAHAGYYHSEKQDFGYAWMGYHNINDIVSKLANNYDAVIVFVHAGLEHHYLPLPEIRSFYQQLCDSGATCVIGGHTHCAQGYEFYNNSFIAYSLGNFYFPRFNNQWQEENTSFSLLLSLENKDDVKVEVIHHTLRNGIVEVEEDPSQQVNLRDYCEALKDNYKDLVDNMCLEVYDNLCGKLLVESLCGEFEKKGAFEILKDLLKRSLFRKKYIISTSAKRNKQLLHLFENETYRFVITRALRIKIQQ